MHVSVFACACVWKRERRKGEVNINMNLYSKTYHKASVGSNEKCARHKGMKSNRSPCVKMTHCTRQKGKKRGRVGERN